MDQLKGSNNCTGGGTWLEPKAQSWQASSPSFRNTALRYHHRDTYLECPLCARRCAQYQGCRDKGMCFLLSEFTVKAREDM